MNTVFQKYMEKRLKPEKRTEKIVKAPIGPVITISRDYGCPAKRLAGLLTSTINQYEIQHKEDERWTWVGKEILEQSAKELHLKPDLIKEIANTDQKGLVDEVLLSFTNKYYPGDFKIKRTIGDIIKEYAYKGKVVIVGRGGVALLQDVKKALHIKLTAPLEWRINVISKRDKISLDDSEKKIKQIDQKRDHLRAFFSKNKVDDKIFDVIFNYYSCSEEEIIACILKMIEKRGFFDK